MTPRDFCFWLQGAFEIAGLTGMTSPQAAIVDNHLRLVFKSGGDDSRAGDFCYWLAGRLQAAESGAVNTATTKAIRERLAGIFAHEIDATTPGDPAQLQQIHDGANARPDGVLPRC